VCVNAVNGFCRSGVCWNKLWKDCERPTYTGQGGGASEESGAEPCEAVRHRRHGFKRVCELRNQGGGCHAERASLQRRRGPVLHRRMGER